MGKPKISIVILTWNTADITLTCVKTIEKYLKKIDYQIIVADNGSTDNTATLLGKRKGVTYFNTGSNLGFAKGNNSALKLVESDSILFLNSDMEFIDSTLLEMISFFEKNPKIGIIGPKFLNIDLSPQGSVFPPQTICNAFKEFWLNKNTYSKYVPKSLKPLSVWSISGGALLIRKSLFIQIGGWDEEYFMYFEDMEMCRQIRKLNYDIVYYPQCKVIHRHGASGKNLASSPNQWRRLIPSSIKYHGILEHYLINFFIWSGQKFRNLRSKQF